MWRVQDTMAKTRTAARYFLTVDDKNEQEDLFRSMLCRGACVRLSVLVETETKLDCLVGFAANILEQRLQTHCIQVGPCEVHTPRTCRERDCHRTCG